MRRLKNVSLEKYNAHSLDNLTATRVISTEERPFDDEIAGFLIGHIRKCSELQRPRAASFNNPEGTVAKSCRAILEDPSAFATESARIGEELYAIMASNRKINPGVLVVCLCHNTEQQYRFMALLKMNPHSVFRASLASSVDIVLEGKALPDPQHQLQKFALVRTPSGGPMPAILLQDMQANADEVAHFFQNDFLRCALCKDNTTRTKEFATTHRNWVNEKVSEGRVSPEDGMQLITACDNALRSGRIVLENFAESVISEAVLAKDYLDYFAESEVDTDFEVDPVTAGRYLKVKRIRLDIGELKVKEADLSDREHFRVEDDPENPEYKVVRIRTRTYHLLN